MLRSEEKFHIERGESLAPSIPGHQHKAPLYATKRRACPCSSCVMTIIMSSLPEPSNSATYSSLACSMV